MATSTTTSNESAEAQTLKRHMEVFLSISRAIGTIMDESLLIDRIMREVSKAFHADRSTLFVHDDQHSQLCARVAQGLTPPDEFRIPDDCGLAGHVFQSRQSLLIHDTFENDLFSRASAQQTGYTPRSMLVVPVSHRPDRAEGVLQVMHSDIHRFTQADLALCEAVAVEVGIKLDNARLYEAQKRQFHSFVEAFSAALDARDTTTHTHSINVANYAMGIGYFLGLSARDLEWLRIAGLLHDVGKIGTPEAVLTKAGKLTDDEYEQMKLHAAQGRAILSKIEFTEDYHDLAYLACAHHERLDGTGYPDGLSADEMPQKARILAVADVWHALTQDRHYRPAMSFDKALGIIHELTPAQLDESCVTALKQYLGMIKRPHPESFGVRHARRIR